MDTKIRSTLLDRTPGLIHGYATAAPEGALFPKQVHGKIWRWFDGPSQERFEGDALATAHPGLPIAVQSADCVPILVAAVDTQGQALAVLAVHAGWRGSVAKILESSVVEFVEKAREKKIPIAKLHAVIGPCIQGKAYEVGAEVAEQFTSERLRPSRNPGKFLLNLPAENRAQIERAAQTVNIPLELEDLAICTLEDPRGLPSFRRNGPNAGRLFSYIALQRR